MGFRCGDAHSYEWDFLGKYVSKMAKATNVWDKKEVYTTANFTFTNLFSSDIRSYFLNGKSDGENRSTRNSGV